MQETECRVREKVTFGGGKKVERLQMRLKENRAVEFFSEVEVLQDGTEGMNLLSRKIIQMQLWTASVL